MTEQIYNSLIPHLTTLESIFECIDMGFQFSDPPRQVIGLMIDSFQKNDPKRKPVDMGCGACVTSAIKQITIEFIHYHRAYTAGK